MIGAAAMRPRSFEEPGSWGHSVVLAPRRFLGSGFTPKSALPIIAALGRGPTWGFARERLLVGRSSRLLKGPRWGLFRFRRGADGPLFCFYVSSAEGLRECVTP